jgi:hypothetical protein
MRVLLLLLFTTCNLSFSQEIALLKYNGGGDWYANPTSLPNLIKFSNLNINTRIKIKSATVSPGSPDIFSYPFIHMTGHGNVVFSDQEAENLRNYLSSGGFLHIDDNYGKFHHHIYYFKSHSYFPADYQKFMSTTEEDHKLTASSLITN